MVYLQEKVEAILNDIATEEEIGSASEGILSKQTALVNELKTQTFIFPLGTFDLQNYMKSATKTTKP